MGKWCFYHLSLYFSQKRDFFSFLHFFAVFLKKKQYIQAGLFFDCQESGEF